MRKTACTLTFIGLIGAVGVLDAQTAPPAPAAQQPRAARPAASPAASTITVQVTNAAGLPLGNVQVTAQGPVSRDGVTADDGAVRFMNMRAGAYRLRFVREGSTTLDRDITVRAG